MTIYTEVPEVVGGKPITSAWGNTMNISLQETQIAVDAVQAQLDAFVVSYPTTAVACTYEAGWENYLGSYAELKVARSGNLVVIAGLARRTGATFVSGQFATIPVGYRPPATILTAQHSSGVMTTPAVTFTAAGAISVAAAPVASIATGGGFVAISASWYLA